MPQYLPKFTSSGIMQSRMRFNEMAATHYENNKDDDNVLELNTAEHKLTIREDSFIIWEALHTHINILISHWVFQLRYIITWGWLNLHLLKQVCILTNIHLKLANTLDLILSETPILAMGLHTSDFKLLLGPLRLELLLSTHAGKAFF